MRQLAVAVSRFGAALALATCIGLVGCSSQDEVDAGADPRGQSGSAQEAAPAPAATSFVIVPPRGFDSPEPDKVMTETRRSLTETTPDDQIPSDGGEAHDDQTTLVEVISGAYVRPAGDGAMDQLIVEVEPASGLPDGVLEAYFDGTAYSKASAASPVTREGVSNRSGDLHTYIFDGTNFVTIMASGLSQTEFSETLRTFEIVSDK